MRMTVSRKLILGFVVVLVMMALLGGLSVTQMNQVNQKTVEIESKWLPAVKNINELTYMIEHLVATDLKHVVSTEPETMKVYEEDINKTVEAIQTAITNYGNTIILEEEKKIYPNLVAEWEWYLKIHNLVIEASKKMEKDFSVVLVQDANERFAGIKATLDSLVQVNAAGAEQASQEGRIIYQASIRGALLLNLAAVVVGLIIAIVISRKISQPVRKMAKLAEQIAQGNLQTEQIVVKSKDEIGNLAEAFNQMAANLRSLVLQVSTSTHQVASSAEELLASADQTSRATEQIASTIQEVAAGSEQQSESVLESTKTVVEMAAGAHQIAEQAQTVAKSAIQAAELSQEGNESIQTAISQINSVHHTMNRLAEVIKELGNRSEEITQIVEVISGIAAQTNLLALNAAIEAARAGENGRGFAVVANEVRMLAEQSSASAQQITILIQGIQAESKRAVNEMNVGTEEVAEGIQLVDSAGEAFGHIQHSINQVAEQIQQVSAAAEQMSASTEHVVQSIRHISKIAEDTAFGTQTASAATQEQLSSMEEIASSASALSHMADELQAMIGKFRT